MVATSLDSDPDNVIGWIIEPLEQPIIHTDTPDKYFIDPFKKLSEYRDRNTRVWIDDGD